MRTAAALSTRAESRSAALDATERAVADLREEAPTLALVFASPHHAPLAQELVQGVHEVAAPQALIGCVAEAVVGGRQEIETDPAVSVWLASLPAAVETFHMEFLRTPSGGVLAGWRFEDGQPDQPATDHAPNVPEARLPVYLMVADPFTFPVDLLLRHLDEHQPGTVVAGGMASGGRRPGDTVLFEGSSTHHAGAVGVRLPPGVPVATLVSQGCRPIGRSYVITSAEGNVLREIGGRTALERLEEILSGLAPPDRALAAQGLHVGRAIDEYKTEHGTGDFLIRGVMGADQETGAMAVGDMLEVGQTVRFHVRDAATADEELRTLLERTVAELGGRPAGALLFTCNGRGTRMFPAPGHDAELVSGYLGGVPLAGMFCAGELGPVGGRNFLHGFTASAVVFVDQPSSRS